MQLLLEQLGEALETIGAEVTADCIRRHVNNQGGKTSSRRLHETPLITVFGYEVACDGKACTLWGTYRT